MTGKKYLNYEQSYNQLVIQFNELNTILIQTPAFDRYVNRKIFLFYRTIKFRSLHFNSRNKSSRIFYHAHF